MLDTSILEIKINKYTQAVNYIEHYVESTLQVQMEVPGVQTALELALEILKAQNEYDPDQ